jgi:hypothetical protein
MNQWLRWDCVHWNKQRWIISWHCSLTRSRQTTLSLSLSLSLYKLVDPYSTLYSMSFLLYSPHGGTDVPLPSTSPPLLILFYFTLIVWHHLPPCIDLLVQLHSIKEYKYTSQNVAPVTVASHNIHSHKMSIVVRRESPNVLRYKCHKCNCYQMRNVTQSNHYMGTFN